MHTNDTYTKLRYADNILCTVVMYHTQAYMISYHILYITYIIQVDGLHQALTMGPNWKTTQIQVILGYWTVQAPQLGIIHFRFCLWHGSKPTFSLNLGFIIDYIQVWRWEISIYWLTIHHVNQGKMEVYWCKTNFSKAIWVPIWELYLNRFSKPS